MRIADLSVQLGLRNQGRNRVDHDDVDRVGFDEHLGNLQPLLPVGRLADQQVFEIDAQALGPGGVERMLGVDKGGDPPLMLGTGNRVQGQRRFTARLRPEKLDHPAPRETPSPQGEIQRESARSRSPGWPNRWFPP